MSESGRAPDNGELCMAETYEGQVIRRIDDEVCVAYKINGERVEQVYGHEQFVGGVLPDEGDQVRVCTLMWKKPPVPLDVKQFLTDDEPFPGFERGLQISKLRQWIMYWVDKGMGWNTLVNFLVTQGEGRYANEGFDQSFGEPKCVIPVFTKDEIEEQIHKLIDEGILKVATDGQQRHVSPIYSSGVMIRILGNEQFGEQKQRDLQEWIKFLCKFGTLSQLLIEKLVTRNSYPESPCCQDKNRPICAMPECRECDIIVEIGQMIGSGVLKTDYHDWVSLNRPIWVVNQ